MSRMLRSVSSFVLVLAVLTAGVAQETPAAQRVVERFAEALSAGRYQDVSAVLGGGATWSEHDLYWRVASGPAVRQRAIDLIAAGARLETEVVAVMGDGRLVIAHERLWGDFVPEGMAPLRSTTVYVVEAGWLVGITRVLSAEQHDALLELALTDSTWRGAHDFVYQFGNDGSVRDFEGLNDLRSGRHIFSGTFHVEHGVLTWIADADSTVCAPGQRIAIRGRLIDQDTWYGVILHDVSECAYFRWTLEPFTTVRFVDD